MKFKRRKGKIGIEMVQEKARVGNFIIESYDYGEWRYLRIRSADGGWVLEFREDTMKYSWVSMLCSETRYHKILESWVVLLYHVTCAHPDPAFMYGIMGELGRLRDRALEEESETKKENDGEE